MNYSDPYDPYEDDFFENEDYFLPLKKDEMIYNDDNELKEEIV